MKCGGCSEIMCLQIGDYSFKSHMFSIEMCGCDIALGVQWLHTVSPITMYFEELYMSFLLVGHHYTF